MEAAPTYELMGKKRIKEENVWRTREARRGLQLALQQHLIRLHQAPTFHLGKKGSTKTNMFDLPTHVFILLSTNLKVRKYMHQRLKRYGVTFTKLAHFSLQYRLSHRIIHDVLEIKLYLHVSGTKTTLSFELCLAN